MENLLNDAQTIGTFAVFAILVIREVFRHIENRRPEEPNRTEQQVDDLTRWRVPRIEEAIGKIAEAQERQSRLLEQLAENGMRKTRILENLLRDKGN